MRTKNLFSGICAASVAALSLVGCSDYDNGYTEKSIIYDKQFTDRFGQIDPNQDWNLVRQLAKASREGETRATTSETVYSGIHQSTHGEVTIVRLDEDDCILWTPEDVMAYDDMLPEKGASDLLYDRPEEISPEDEEKYTNLGKVTQDFVFKGKQFTMYPLYWNTGNSNTIGVYFDVPEGTVGDNIETVTTNTGETRTIQLIKVCQGNKSKELEMAKDVWGSIKFGAMDDKYKNALINKFPDKYKIAEGGEQALDNDWTTFQEGDFLLKVGTRGDGSPGYIAMYEYTNDEAHKEEVVNDLNTIYPGKFAIADGTDAYPGEYGTCSNGDVVMDIIVTSSLEWYQDAGDAINRDGATHLRSWGISVTIPTGIIFGFYIENGDGRKYSETALNEKETFSDAGEQEVAYAATYDGNDGEGEPCRYLCFEDWMKGGKNFDLNDVVFRVFDLDDDDVIDKDKPQTDDKKEEVVTTIISEGLLVCEDLGDYDFDFNDVVLKLQQKQTKKVTTVNGVKKSEEILSNTLDVTAMAAGGTLTSYIYYKYDEVSEGKAISADNEIHQLLNGSDPDIINAGSQFGSEGKIITLKIGEGKDLEKWDETDYPADKGGYVTQVFEHGLIYALVENQTPITNITSGTNYDKRNAPQMMLLPTDFLWPTEGTTISTVYEGFTNWVGNANVTNWYKNYNDINKVTQRNTGK